MKRRTLPIAIGLLCLQATLLAHAATRRSPAWDEVGQLASGIYHWKAGRFDLYRVNPPLIRMIAAIPALFVHRSALEFKPRVHDIPGRRSEWEAGQSLVRSGGSRVFRLFTLGRWACIPFCLLGGVICFTWSRDLYGSTAGLSALMLWTLSPNVLGCGSLLTCDLGATSLGLLANYSFWCWLRRPSWRTSTVAGLTLGLAQLSKATWIVLFALWPLLWAVVLYRGVSATRRGRTAVQLLAVFGLGLYVVNAGYGFEGVFRKLGSYRFISRSLGGDPAFTIKVLDPGRNRFAGTPLENLPVPLPENYLRGIDVQKREFEDGYWSYLFGEFRREGRWYYYPVCLGLKVPLGTWILVILAFVNTRSGRKRSSSAWQDSLVLLAPAAVLLCFVSTQTGINNHFRYIVPILPYLFVWCGGRMFVAGMPGFRNRLACAALLTSAVGSLWQYPNSLSYANELAGGPGRAYRLFGCAEQDSTLTWGRDAYYLAEWLDEHPDRRPDGLVCDCPRAILAGLGVNHPPPPSMPAAGRFIVGLKNVYGRNPQFHYFRQFVPVHRIGVSLLLYDISDESLRDTFR